MSSAIGRQILNHWITGKSLEGDVLTTGLPGKAPRWLILSGLLSIPVLETDTVQQGEGSL